MAPTPHTDLMRDPDVQDRLDFWSARYARLFRLHHEDHDDLRQEMAIAIFKDASRFDPARSSWRTFLKLLCRTAARRFLVRRDRVYRIEVLVPDHDGLVDLPWGCVLCKDNIAANPMEQIEWRDWLNAMLAEVSPEMLRTLTLCAEGLTFTEVAQVLGVHRNTVTARIKLLRALVGEMAEKKCPADCAQ